MSKNYYITTPIYYVNDKPHIGSAYTTIAADVLARFKRLDGFNVKFLTGTDEHGQKVEKSAEKAGIDTQNFVDQVSQNFRDLMPIIEATPDRFIRTTEPDHIQAAQALWNRLVQYGEIYLGSYAGWYAVRDEAYYAESEIVDGKAPTGAEVEWVEEPSYFFRLSKWQDKLLHFYEKHPDFILPRSRRNEVIRFVEGGLNDLSISRTTFKWGIPVPNDPDHIMYVWLDALTNYITALGFPDIKGKDYTEFWPESIHLVGKDILRFHTVYWPAFLMAAGLEPPKRIFAHGWWTSHGQKISKSLGNAIDPIDLIEKYSADALRYFMIREVSFGQDGDFTEQALQQRINSDLANAYGNLVQRVLSFVYKNCDAVIPQAEELSEEDKEMLTLSERALGDLRKAIDTQALHKTCDIIWRVVYEANIYVDAQKPWALKKTDSARMGTVLNVLCRIIYRVAAFSSPILPKTSARIYETLNINAPGVFEEVLGTDLAGKTINQPEPLFQKIDIV